MSGIGVGLVWFSYWWGLGGYSMIRGWNNSVLALANPIKLATFTTQCYTGPNVFPSGDPADSGACSGSSKPPTQVGIINPGKNHSCPAGFTYNPKTKKCDRKTIPPTGR